MIAGHDSSSAPPPRLQRKSGGPATLYWSAALFALGFAAGLLALALRPPPPPGAAQAPVGKGCEMFQIARTLSRGGGFANPIPELATGPTALEPPLYPLLLSLGLRGLKSESGAAVAGVFATMLANALAAGLLVWVSDLMFGMLAPGIIAALLSIASANPMPCWDVNFTQLALVCFFLQTACMMSRPGGLALRGAAAGAMAGLIALFNPMSALVSTPCAAFFLARRRPGAAGALRFGAAFILAAFLVNAPWLVRNYRLWGEWIVRTSFGVTLYESNNDCAAPSLAANVSTGCSPANHPGGSIDEARTLARLGEPAYNRLQAARAFAWIRSHPARFSRLTARRVVDFWFPELWRSPALIHIVWAITALSIPGLVWMRRCREPALAFLLAVFALYPPAYYIVVSDVRYRMPVLWLSCLAAGYFLAHLWRTLGARLDRTRATSPAS